MYVANLRTIPSSDLYDAIRIMCSIIKCWMNGSGKSNLRPTMPSFLSARSFGSRISNRFEFCDMDMSIIHAGPIYDRLSQLASRGS